MKIFAKLKSKKRLPDELPKLPKGQTVYSRYCETSKNPLMTVLAVPMGGVFRKSENNDPVSGRPVIQDSRPTHHQ
jgi:hypothetical protein